MLKNFVGIKNTRFIPIDYSLRERGRARAAQSRLNPIFIFFFPNAFLFFFYLQVKIEESRDVM